jgi:predicted nuclease of predicted toxin-antitoxin system
MIKILLDECLPKKLNYRIEDLDPDFFAKTTPEKGWASLSNGELLSVAENEFDVFITSDKNLSFQQSIPFSSIQVVLLKAKTNTYEDLLPLVKKLTSIIKDHEPGNFLEID